MGLFFFLKTGLGTVERPMISVERHSVARLLTRLRGCCGVYSLPLKTNPSNPPKKLPPTPSPLFHLVEPAALASGPPCPPLQAFWPPPQPPMAPLPLLSGVHPGFLDGPDLITPSAFLWLPEMVAGPEEVYTEGLRRKGPPGGLRERPWRSRARMPPLRVTRAFINKPRRPCPPRSFTTSPLRRLFIPPRV